MTDLTSLTIAEARDALAKGETISVALTDAYLSAIEAANGELNAYVVRNCRQGPCNGESLRCSPRHRARSARWKAFRLASRIFMPPRATIRRLARTFLTVSSRVMNRPSLPISGRMALSSLAN